MPAEAFIQVALAQFRTISLALATDRPTHLTRRAPIAGLSSQFRRGSLAVQFLAAGSVVSIAAMLLVGVLVTNLIERAVIRNAAATTALYVDSVIAPLLPDMRGNAPLDEPIARALDETLGQGALGSRLESMRIWSRDGQVLYSRYKSDEASPAFTADASTALAGEIGGRFHASGHTATTSSGPLLAIYNPILQPWSGEVVGVMEFFERADELHATLQRALFRSWLAVAAITGTFFLLLGAIVMRGSRTIDSQAATLASQVDELSRLLDSNRMLQARVARATQRAAAHNERYLRRLGADLHDGPAQLIAYASLRLDSDTLADDTHEERPTDLARIRQSLDDALHEIRSICRGLVLPRIEGSDLAQVVERAIADHERRTGFAVERNIAPVKCSVPLSQRICGYRFLQECLNNSHRHAPGSRHAVKLESTRDSIRISVTDDGAGFDPSEVCEDSIGLAGMRERVESLGGQFVLQTSSAGTAVTMTISTKEQA